jgi:hypothetical protein
MHKNGNILDWGEMTWEWRRLHNEEFYDLDIIIWY